MYGVLVVSDDSNFLSQAQRMIPNINNKIIVETLNVQSKVKDVLKSTKKIDVVLCEHNPPEMDAFTVFNEMNRMNYNHPFIIVTRKVDGEVAIEASDQRMDYYTVRKNDMNFFMDIVPKIVSSAERKKSQENREVSEKRNSALMTLLMMREREFSEILTYALEESVNITNSKIGYIAMYDEENNKLKMAAWSKGGMDQCKMEVRPITYDFDMTGVWGEPIRKRKPIIINDYGGEKTSSKVGTPRGHVQLNRLLMIPIYHNGKILATAGLGNKATKYDSEDLMQFTLLMDGLISIYHERILEGVSEKAERNLKGILQNAPIGILIVDEDMSIVVSNNYAMSMIDKHPLKATESSLKYNNDIISDIIRKNIEKAKSSNGSIESEHTLEKDGQNMVLKINVSSIKNKDNKDDGFIVIVDDISEITAVNRQQAIAREGINLLDSMINEDIREHLAKMDEALHEDSEEARKIIGDGVEALTDIMNFVKEYHEVGMTELKWQDLEESIGNAVDVNELDDEDIDCNVRGIRILADPLFSNVFTQLIQFSKTRSEGDLRISIKCRLDEGNLIIIYSDNCKSIPPEQKDDLMSGKGMDHGRRIYLAGSILKASGFIATEQGHSDEGLVLNITVPDSKYSISWE